MTHPPSPNPPRPNPQRPDPGIAGKKAARAHAVAVRAEANRRLGDGAAEALAVSADALGVAAGTVVAGYWPMGDEIDPRPLMLELAKRGCRLALPVVTARGQALEFRTWAPGDELEPGPFGTVHPLASAPHAVPTVLLVPLLAFDRLGFRLGYGGGFYDRTLVSLRAASHLTAIGVAYAAQEVPSVPRDKHDQRLDRVVTEAGVIALESL
jgi:5-formyltetrahydrofolate cyclo-ligase